MNQTKTFALLGLAAGCTVAGAAQAAEIFVSGDITTSQVWTADNTYNLQDQVYVKNGATLTIEAGVIVASTPTANGSGSLAITRGSQIFVQGTADNPVIMTSTNDDFTNLRQAANEWGNLTIMGEGYISNTCTADNTPTCACDNLSPMEGLVPDFAGDPDTLYGGCNDEDSSGSIEYLSLRYGGRVVGLANELNGLSLGGIGRGTVISHVEIMNNVDDGIEIWGGTVDLKHFSIWNVGDDSLDIDQGWRGRAQFGLIVQGYSIDAVQGSGVGDNCIETDGAEDADAQPCTTGTLYNLTVIGQPVPGAGDGGTAWRMNARLQYRNSIWMDIGEKLIRPDDNDGDCEGGYGFGCTPDWLTTWTLPYTYSHTQTCNACPDPVTLYQAQVDGNLCEIKDSVFFRNLNGAYGDSDILGVTVAGGSSGSPNNNVVPAYNASDIDENMPIQALTRGAPFVTVESKTMLPVVSLDPRAANDALTPVGPGAPNNGFYTPAAYRGAFDADTNWLCGWSASWQFGLLVCPEPDPCPWDFDGSDSVGIGDLNALLSNWGAPCPGAGCSFDYDGSGSVGLGDLNAMLSNWGPCPAAIADVPAAPLKAPGAPRGRHDLSVNR
jgi:hypothetical protein